jgi:hypothetical protein
VENFYYWFRCYMSLVLRKLIHFIAQLHCKQWLYYFHSWSWYLPYRHIPTFTSQVMQFQMYFILKNDKNIKRISFFKYKPIFSSRKWKHNEVVVVEGYCWVRAHSPSQSRPLQSTRLTLEFWSTKCCCYHQLGKCIFFTVYFNCLWCQL